MSAAVVRLPVLSDAEARRRPVTRGDCVDGPRPCPWVSCSHHSIHGVLLGEAGRELTEDQVVEAIEAMSASCTLDVADEGGVTLEAVGEPWGVTRERIRQLEARALKRVKPRSLGLVADLSEDELPASVPAPKRVAAARIDWMGEDGDPAETDTAPAAMGAEESTVSDKRIQTGGAQITTPAPGARCGAYGCEAAPQGYREGLDPLLRPLCKRHRLLAQGERTKRQCSTQEAVAIILRRAAASNGCETAPQGARGIAEAPLPVAFDAPVVEAPAQGLFDGPPEVVRDLRTPAGDELASLREERDWLLTQRDAARAEVAELRRDRDAVAADLAQVREKAAAESRGLAQHLDARDARIAELEGQLLADATSREPSPRPLARLAALAAVLVSTDAGDRIAWTVGSTRAGDGRWCASALGCDEAGVSDWEAEGNTPDEALAALVGVLEGEAHARIEALTAALRGAR